MNKTEPFITQKIYKMKNKSLIIFLLFISSTFFSCSSDESLNYGSEYEISKNAWLKFKKSSNNSYKYIVTNESWAGFSWETTITIKNGIIEKREFKYISTTGLSNDVPTNELQWIENKSEIGTHENGAKPMTLDEVYNKAQQDWLIERGNTKIHFEKNNNGMISVCGYTQNNCTDDCFIGIKISNIQAL